MRVTDDVMLILTNCRTEGDKLWLPGQLERPTYEKVNKVLEAAGWKWSRKDKAHLADGGAAEALDQIVLTGEVARPQDFGFFETPDAVAGVLVGEADVQPGQTILEPSAGRGALARRLAGAADQLDCYEVQAKHCAYLRAAFAGLPVGVEEADFLAVSPVRIYDRVVMNPPFAKRQDVAHVMHALKFLKPGGVLAAVMSAGARFRQDRMAQDFRAAVDAGGGYIEDLPDGSFRESGTNVRTVLVVIPQRI
jgi:predicted RNA methylase